LDALRGLAALCVVFSHWKHFFFIPGNELTPFRWELHPLNFLFKPLYTDGYRAVELFFCLSGFIFFWLYSEKISRRQTSLREFVVLRFSRLYPLHFLTLLFVVAGQQFMHWRYGAYFVYAQNDLYHFGLQLLFASNWGFERGLSFNGPIWSVSVEILCYAAFFLACISNSRRWWHLGMFIVIGYSLSRIHQLVIGEGIFSFFIGGVSFQIFAHLWGRGIHRKVLPGLGIFTALMWIFIPLNTHYDILYQIYHRVWFWPAHLNLFGKDVVGFAVQEISRLGFDWLLFPLTILTLALWEACRGTLGKRLSFLGDISYSSYLWHFPLQLIFVAAASACALPNTFFCTPWALFLFFLTLIPLSLCSYRFFERPCQSWLRTRLVRPAADKLSPRGPHSR
jgi:peptidoglycan/LPS O-acetylase OafA/YrhL